MARLELLLRDVRNCTICSDQLPLSPKPVFQFHPRARILIASQAPGRKAHDSGIPFTDVSGNRLRNWLGLAPDIFYDPRRIAIVPMAFCYPGTGSNGDFAPRPECAAAWRDKLLSRLSDLRLTLVIGRYAQEYHLPAGRRSVTEAVAAWRDHLPSVVPLPHPSPRNIRWVSRNPWFVSELLPNLKTLIHSVLEMT